MIIWGFLATMSRYTFHKVYILTEPHNGLLANHAFPGSFAHMKLLLYIWMHLKHIYRMDIVCNTWAKEAISV